MTFFLHPNLGSKTEVIDLPLCKVVLEDEQHYPWLILIPKRMEVSKIIDLTKEDQLQLLKELEIAQHILWDLFSPTQLNVAALGNKTPQLHIHVIGRFVSDPAWPKTVWDHPTKALYTDSQKKEVLAILKQAFEEAFSKA